MQTFLGELADSSSVLSSFCTRADGKEESKEERRVRENTVCVCVGWGGGGGGGGEVAKPVLNIKESLLVKRGTCLKTDLISTMKHLKSAIINTEATAQVKHVRACKLHPN